MGEVHRAYDTRHDRVVALKLLTDHTADEPEFRQRFKQEAHTAARLREPHVIPIHAYGEINGRLYPDMRLVEGTDLSKTITGQGPLRPADAVDVITQIAGALDAAHAEGLHRDVKPSNVILGTSGSPTSSISVSPARSAPPTTSPGPATPWARSPTWRRSGSAVGRWTTGCTSTRWPACCSSA
jgi:serine/threonine protein kinase